ncbi:hypothetical protein [Legionella septentrionalis]|uniref:hypothetical protein n=1 Tax=Legionella septentrionalis TaxID=2498109 RepID=UPI000F8D777F|nr:hypothetical protein [Legionella septentrionalis]RUR10936.1 hypothetical protein ELY14_03795 [Legionella septentrionalis]
MLTDRVVYSPGDVLLKIDMRGWYPESETFNTRHHVMLVLGVKEGYPIVAHMTFHNKNNLPGLISETLNRGKDLFLIHYQFSEQVRAKIVDLVQQALQSKQFVITKHIIKEQHIKSLPYREKMLSIALKNLAAGFNVCDFDAAPETIKKISCHEFVLAIIHNACRQCNEEIPESLRMPPSLAWADFWLQAAYDHPEEAKVICMPAMYPLAKTPLQKNSIFAVAASPSFESMRNASCAIL